MAKKRGGLKLPLRFEEALSDLLKVKPPAKTAAKPTSRAERKKRAR